MPDDVTVESLDHTGDAGLIVTAPTLTRLFTACAEEMTRLACPAGEVRRALARPIEAAGHDLVELLVNWLSEINGLGAAHRELYGAFFLDEFLQSDGDCRLRGRVDGEPIDLARHHLSREIKAITFHQAEVIEANGRWRARVIFDL